ncbi:hypothetical protein DY218_10885 [Streptomyces triticagri]|uniref:Tetratricopeptide repeat protein n=1 Tax=Streptomyces triticagri TaxID=2293568 RepID=A0A372M876_9ACTN|nr:hypothetical protein [Streptomyces triticagri]RFU86643.1 hypothetical protein DY218_10885 [Streptomyces triticagri]
MTSSTVTSSTRSPRPNVAFRRLRGSLSPGEFASLVRRAGQQIGERVSCDARYIGRVEAGEIRCPNYAYERVFLHMFPGRTLSDLGFASRASVRGRAAREVPAEPPAHAFGQHAPRRVVSQWSPRNPSTQSDEVSDVLRRAFMTVGGAAVAASVGRTAEAAEARVPRRVGTAEALALEDAVRRIRLLDDRHGADGLYRRALGPLRTAHALLDSEASRQSVSERLHAGAGELAISVGWLAHDSGRLEAARAHYAEALATARMSGDGALETHALCNMSFLARDAGRPREAVRAAQAAQRSARASGSSRLQSLLALREAGGWAGLGDRAGCGQSLSRAQGLFEAGASDADPEWMSFYGEAELAGLEAQCWSALGDWPRAARQAERAVGLQDPHFTRNIALYTAEEADDLARAGAVDEAAAAGGRVLDVLGEVGSARIHSILAGTARLLRRHGGGAGVSDFLERHAAVAG